MQHVEGEVAAGASSALMSDADAPQLASAAVQLARAAIELLDLRQHAASHPRLGVVDHVSLQPAGSGSALDAAAEAAQAIGAVADACFHPYCTFSTALNLALPQTTSKYGQAQRPTASTVEMVRVLALCHGTSIRSD